MMPFLFAAIAMSQGLPLADNFAPIDWEPRFTEVSDLRITAPTVAMMTHCSRAFDPLEQSIDAVRTATSTMKQASLPVLYLHDKYNSSNPAWMYLYDDWHPTAYVRSDVGHIEMELSQVDHVVCLGGYYGQCERSTVTDVIRLWHRDGYCHNLRITQVVDGVFTVGQHLRYEDPYNQRVRDFHRSQLQNLHPKAVMTIDQVISRIDEPDQVVEFLKRNIPGVPADINVVMDVFGRAVPLQIVDAETPVLTFAYRRSDDFLNFREPKMDWNQPAKSWRRSMVPSNTTQSLPLASAAPSSISRPPVTNGRVILGSEIYSSPIPNGVIVSDPFAPTPSPTNGTVIYGSSIPFGTDVLPSGTFSSQPGYVVPQIIAP